MVDNGGQKWTFVDDGKADNKGVMPTSAKPIFKLRTAIRPSLFGHALKKGTIIAFFGAILILYAGSKLSKVELGMWGLSIFFIGLGLITIGLLPYRRIKKLESKPDEIWLIGHEALTICSQGKRIFTLPIACIKKMNYLENGKTYGIAIELNSNFSEKILVHDPGFNLITFQETCRKQFNSDLFLRYFSRTSHEEILGRIPASFAMI